MYMTRVLPVLFGAAVLALPATASAQWASSPTVIIVNGGGWGPGWNAGWGPGWNAGWGPRWAAGWGPGWGGPRLYAAWGPRWGWGPRW
jgi:hypothetical protein